MQTEFMMTNHGGLLSASILLAFIILGITAVLYLNKPKNV